MWPRRLWQLRFRLPTKNTISIAPAPPSSLYPPLQRDGEGAEYRRSVLLGLSLRPLRVHVWALLPLKIDYSPPTLLVTNRPLRITSFNGKMLDSSKGKPKLSHPRLGGQLVSLLVTQVQRPSLTILRTCPESPPFLSNDFYVSCHSYPL